MTRRCARWLLLIGSGAVLMDAALHSGLAPTPIVPLISQTLRDFPAAVGFAAVVAAVAGGPRRRLVLTSPPLVGLGIVSYGVYLWHLRVLLALRSENALPLHLIPALAVVLAITVAIAAFSWLALERPILAWAHRITRGPAAPQSGRRQAVAPSRP